MSLSKKNNSYIGTDFSDYLAKELKNPRNRALFDEYGRQLEIAYQILQLRKRKRMSQKLLAKKIGSTQSNVARMEGGSQNFTISLLDKVAAALGAELSINIS
jgi:ribosome-binding protein aMBF1 (putative translation factor)